MRFRPCIDIHNGAVKQIVGGSLVDKGDLAVENFVAKQDAGFFANLYKEYGLTGGHIILLNHANSEYYEATKKQALLALKEYPKGLEIGGGINPDNAYEFLEAGASHVIVTSYVFKDGIFDYDALDRMISSVGKEQLVLDLSARKKDGLYYITTDRWQKFTSVVLNEEILTELSFKCDEFLVHAVDVEGKSRGIEEDIVKLLSNSPIDSTYAGGVHNFDDLEMLSQLGKGRVDVTIGSALDLFGGTMEFSKVLDYMEKKKPIT